MTGQARRVDEQLAGFFEDEHAQLTGLLTLVTGDRHIAEELAQEALEGACANWPRVRNMHNRRAWLRRIALNLAASRYRRRRAEWRANRRHGEATARIEETAVYFAVREAVASLPPRQRTVIALRYFVGHDVAQTATVMSIDARPAELGSPRRALPDPGTTADTRSDTRSDTTSMISRLVTRPGRRALGVRRACARSIAVTIGATSLLPPTLPPARVGRLLGIGRRQTYEGIHRGEIRAIRIGRRLLVPTSWVLEQLGLPVERLISVEDLPQR